MGVKLHFTAQNLLRLKYKLLIYRKYVICKPSVLDRTSCKTHYKDKHWRGNSLVLQSLWRFQKTVLSISCLFKQRAHSAKKLLSKHRISDEYFLHLSGCPNRLCNSCRVGFLSDRYITFHYAAN